jgi:hypothetical protein
MKLIDQARAAMLQDRPQFDRTTAVADELALERLRQIEAEGFAAARDDAQIAGQLAAAAACYALSARLAAQPDEAETVDVEDILDLWPWPSFALWKPKDARRDLVRAGALILAEIERLDRLEKYRLVIRPETILKTGPIT